MWILLLNHYKLLSFEFNRYFYPKQFTMVHTHAHTEVNQSSDSQLVGSSSRPAVPLPLHYVLDLL
jgi:hypothetical protein